MTAASRLRSSLVNSGHIATVTVVTIAFVVTYIAYFADTRRGETPPFSAAELAVATVLGVVYLFLILAGDRPYKRYFGRHALAVTFIVLITLMLAIAFILAGTNGIWLIFMPVVATAVTEMPPRSRWLVYAAALFGMFAPLYYATGDWEVALYATLIFSPALVFVIIFVKATQKAELAQARAEELAAELADANRRLGEYAVQVEELATTQERNRLAREIHDNLGHYLTVVNVQINAARALLGKDTSRADAALETAARLTQEGLAAVRQSVSSLRESPLGRHTLPEAVSALAREAQATGMVAEVHLNGVARPLDPRTELTLYRTAQEGLTNVRKHARASRVDLTLDYRDPAMVSLSVYDNGLGLSARTSADGFGLLGLEERARQLGGRMTAGPSPEGGFSLMVGIPDPITGLADMTNGDE